MGGDDEVVDLSLPETGSSSRVRAGGAKSDAMDKGMVEEEWEVNEWDTGLLDCMDDPVVAVRGVFLNSYYTVRTMRWLRYELMSPFDYFMAVALCTPPCYPFKVAIELYNRTKIKKKYNLDDGEMLQEDYAQSFACNFCMACQHVRQMKIRGDVPADFS